MAKKHFRPTRTNRAKNSPPTADSPEKNGSNPSDYANSPDYTDSDDFDAIGGKRVYSDVYTIGREQNDPNDHKNSENKKNRQGKPGAFTRILSSHDFLTEYGKLHPKGENRPISEKKSAKAAGKKSKNDLQADSTDPRRGKNVGSEPGSRGKAVGLRIIGGKFRALSLLYSGDHRVRPMKDRLRESVFNLLGTTPRGRHAIDLFAGTGALAFEALSRGAESATLVEVHFPTSRVIRSNIARLEEKEPGISSKIDLKTTDVFFWGKNRPALDELPQDRSWLVFCSPPYDFYVDREEDMLELLRHIAQAAPDDSVFVVEADNRFDFDRLGVSIPPKKRKSYPPAEIAMYTSES